MLAWRPFNEAEPCTPSAGSSAASGGAAARRTPCRWRRCGGLAIGPVTRSLACRVPSRPVPGAKASTRESGRAARSSWRSLSAGSSSAAEPKPCRRPAAASWDRSLTCGPAMRTPRRRGQRHRDALVAAVETREGDVDLVAQTARPGRERWRRWRTRGLQGDIEAALPVALRRAASRPMSAAPARRLAASLASAVAAANGSSIVASSCRVPMAGLPLRRSLPLHPHLARRPSAARSSAVISASIAPASGVPSRGAKHPAGARPATARAEVAPLGDREVGDIEHGARPVGPRSSAPDAALGVAGEAAVQRQGLVGEIAVALSRPRTASRLERRCRASARACVEAIRRG